MDGVQDGGERQLLPLDAAVLDIRESRSALSCAVRPVRPELGFDLGFHSGYRVRFRLRDLAGEGGVLTAVFRVIPEGTGKRPAYFSQQWRIPAITADADGEVELEGAFIVGEGDYQVDWLIRDDHERVCSAYWRVSARFGRTKAAFKAALSPGSIIGAGAERDRILWPKTESREAGRRLVVFVHIGSSVSGTSEIPVQEKEAVLSILHGISREPGIARFTVVAFNLDNRTVIFNQDEAQNIDFAGLKLAIDSIRTGTVPVNLLAQKDSEARFLADLIGGQTPSKHADGVIFLGAARPADARFTNEMLQQLGNAGGPVFYLSYSPRWSSNPRADLIGSAVRHWRGHKFNINSPLDFASAWSNIMSGITRREYVETASGVQVKSPDASYAHQR